MKNVITTKQAAEILGCNVRSVYGIVDRYKYSTGEPVTMAKVGRAWAYDVRHIRNVVKWRRGDNLDLNTEQAAEILECNTRSVPTIAQRYRLATGEPVPAEKIGNAWAWSGEHIRKVAEWRKTDPKRDGATFTNNTFDHMPTSRRKVKRLRLGRKMREIAERKGLDVLR